MRNRKILETVADIAYIAGEMKYYSGESRGDISDFIYWAEEFEKIHKKTDWDTYEKDYIEAIIEFANAKLKDAVKLIDYSTKKHSS